MKLTILDRYIGKQVLLGVLFALLVLVGLRTLFTLLDEAGRLGEGNYEFLDALYYSLLLLPSRLYDFFPMAVLIGGLSGLGLLASNNELTVMRAAGIHTFTIVLSAIKVTVVLMVLVFAIGEWLTPISSQAAQRVRAEALSGDHISHSKRGIWARDRQDILHIDSVISQTKLAGVTLFQRDSNAQIIAMIQADEVEYGDGGWVFQNARRHRPTDDMVTFESLTDYVWQGELKPEHVAVLTIEPEMLNLSGLYEYQRYLEKNQLDNRLYQLEFWRKLAQPLSLVVMIVLASSFVFGPMRSVSMGARLMTGIVVGFGFHIVNNFFGPMSLIYNLPAVLGATMPIVVFALLSAYLLKRAR
jgi:lipopolysaccharide export system permease protein